MTTEPHFARVASLAPRTPAERLRTRRTRHENMACTKGPGKGRIDDG